ncbi:RidA family protein [Enorma burkinafasonensis]|uniref:RidA family protein n=1 Tax=Enorma burkinafasonensis TaxID=2590867 RepID=UPI00119DBA57|nr:RidA family protein [Enorma burkinafasonensis]
MDKHVIASENAPAALGPYSAGITTGNLAFLSGQLGLDPTTGELAQGVVAQAEQALKNIEALLAAAGATFGNVVKTTVFLADIADFNAVNEVYGAHFTEPYPARSAVQVAALPKGALVEIECIVAL